MSDPRARLVILKRWILAASIGVFASVGGLVAQHARSEAQTTGAASATTSSDDDSTSGSLYSSGGGYAFGNGSQQSAPAVVTGGS